jgi:acetolactate synthase-1/2/3 large subunit
MTYHDGRTSVFRGNDKSPNRTPLLRGFSFVRLADWVVSFLESKGIDHAFTVSGGGSIFLCDALATAKRMKYVSCHHEQAAAMAAEAYGRARTGLGLCVVTSGPGGTNAITGVAGAWLDHIPMIVLSGQCFSGQTIGDSGLRQKGVQELNIIDLVRPITKYAVMVDGAESIRYHFEKALYLATEGRPGPVWLDIPADVQKAEIAPETLSGFGHEETRAPVAVDAVLTLLRNAKRPLLHVGQGVRWAGAEKALTRFLHVSGIPVLTARNGNDLIDSRHPQYIGRPGTFAQRGANFAVQTCDLYLAVGTRLSLAQTGYNAKDYARNAKVVMVDVDRAELDKDTVNVHLKIEADAGEFLRALSDAMPQLPDWSGWLKRCKDWQARYPVVLPEYREGARINSYVLMDALSDILTPEHVIVTDVGFAYQSGNQALRLKSGQRLMSNGGLASMGWGLPAAIGASFATDRPVLCITGDGGLMMNAQELSTLAHHKRNVKIIVLNNGGYLTQKQAGEYAFGRVMGSSEESISFPDFCKLAAAHGIYSFRVDSHFELGVSLIPFMAMDGPGVCEIVMDQNQEQAPKALNRRLPDGSMKPTAIEDAYPFLDPAEIAENLRVE